MKISFDKLASGREFALSRSDAKRFLEQVVPPEVLARIVKVHFGCNRATTQEAQIVARGSTYEIRVNFWLENGVSRVLSPAPEWTEGIRAAGGIISSDPKQVEWPDDTARRYAAFLLAHEVAHPIYAAERGIGSLSHSKRYSEEDRWCDEWAWQAVRKALPAKSS